jgi:uncharacterized protein YndB with AHSA1/START domain
MGMGGAYRELARPERIVCTELMDDYTSESLVTMVLTETEDKGCRIDSHFCG